MKVTPLFRTNRSQAVRIPKELAFGPGIHEVAVVREVARLLITPADAAWDEFFDRPGIDVERGPQLGQDREPF